jgi:hypothetical protein
MSAQNSIGFQDFPVPIGAILYWAGDVALNPQLAKGGWIIPQGQALIKADYPELWSLLARLGATDAGTTFLAPDLVTPRANTLGYNFLLPTDGLIASPAVGATIPTNLGPLPPAPAPFEFSATLTEANLPPLPITYAPNSLSYRATFINNIEPSSTQLYTNSSTIPREADTTKYVRTDTSFANSGIFSASNLTNYTLAYENLNPPTPITTDGVIVTGSGPGVGPPVPPHLTLVPIMKASYSTILI